jgi:hypothetical protein
MRKKITGPVIKIVVTVLLCLWPLSQLFHFFQGKANEKDTGYLLFQVSLFQMELLNSYLQDPGRIEQTTQLDPLKQALYSATYSHERLVTAFGEKHIPSLRSLSELMQAILRMQIGGGRALKKEETGALQEAAKLYGIMYESYQKLVSPSGSPISSNGKALSEADEQLAKLIEKKLRE